MVQAILAEEEAEVTATVQQEVSHITSNINKVCVPRSRTSCFFLEFKIYNLNFSPE